MIFNTITLALALSATASAAALQSRQSADPCQDAWKACIAAGTPEVACGCTLATCVGEDNARTREFCASATASLSLPKSTSIPGGCNPAHPGSCPSSYFQTSTAPPATFTPIPGIPGGCNPAHPGSCPSSYFQTTTKPATPAVTDCPDETTSVSVPKPVAPTPSAAVPAGSNPVLVPGKTWTIANLTRYCGSDNTGCDYNFAVVANGKTERCTVIRMPGSSAATESWSNQPCTTGSDIKISWGYATSPAPPFAVITVNQGKELAWFGVANVNGGRVTASAPFGSGDFGTLPASPVYTYN
ncbi:hypothetical protein T440DRAFT_470415 [Plenodomus tracheiphilus IPT5]|uniref:Extracellular membrane protein CFEM domain-containing protein n=1 Tax=Plenodomus tracheiphilus IPT5 TaxID=1408161 RepID=A0A6A7AZ16_9PLEO|nr:hypothetical protein T440DRAFT_470415 [Plenodomus tracheiphilus IPT5]